LFALGLVTGAASQPMARSMRKPERKIPTPMTVARAMPPNTTKKASRTTERTRCHQRIRARRPVATRWGGWNQMPRRAPGLHGRSTAYSRSPVGGRDRFRKDRRLIGVHPRVGP